MSKRPLSELLCEDSTSTRYTKPRLTALPLTLPLPVRNAAPASPPPFQKPVQLLSFSYTSRPSPHNADCNAHTRTLEWSDASLRYYLPPPNGADLAHGYSRWVRRPEERPRLDGLLAACVRRECMGARAAAGVVTWRGVVTKILTAPYEVRDGWALNVMCVRGTLYLEEHLTEDQLREKTDLDEGHRLMTYYGYAFESYCTADAPRADSKARRANGWGGDVDTNVQWCSVVKTKLGNVRMILGGEVDCVRDRYTGQPDTFVELKTSLALRPGNPHDAAKFEKKLLKFHIQSFLLGVPEIVVGFRTPAGRLQTVQTFRTLEIPRLVRGTRDAWDPAVCLAWGAHVFEFLRKAVEGTQEEHEEDDREAGGESVVWRATFTPGKGIAIQQLDATAVEDVRGGEPRVGFLPHWYWDELQGDTGPHIQPRVQRESASASDGKDKPYPHGRNELEDAGATHRPVTQVQGWQL